MKAWKPNLNIPHIFYYIKINFKNQYYYKIGITKNKIYERYTKKERNNMKVLLWQEYYGDLAYQFEKH